MAEDKVDRLVLSLKKSIDPLAAAILKKAKAKKSAKPKTKAKAKKKAKARKM